MPYATHAMPQPDPVAMTIEQDEGFSHTIEVSAAFGSVVFERIVDEEGRQIEMDRWTMTNAQAEEFGLKIVEMARRARQ